MKNANFQLWVSPAHQVAYPISAKCPRRTMCPQRHRHRSSIYSFGSNVTRASELPTVRLSIHSALCIPSIPSHPTRIRSRISPAALHFKLCYIVFIRISSLFFTFVFRRRELVGRRVPSYRILRRIQPQLCLHVHQ
jgi:hypothetical protein